MNNLPLIYVIVICWNGKKWLPACLSSLSDMHYANCKVVVVDNGSNDGSSDYIKKNWSTHHLIANQKNLGFAGGCNVGIKYALNQDAEYIVLLNQDTKVDAEWLAELVKSVQKNPDLGIVSPIQFNYNGSNLDKNLDCYLKANTTYYSDMKNGTVKDIYRVHHLIGAALLLTRSLCVKTGIFDEMFFSYVEETDLCRRAIYHGFSCGIATNSIIYHHHELLNRKDKKNSRSCLLIYRNNLIYIIKDPGRSLLYSFIIFFKQIVKDLLSIAFRHDVSILCYVYGVFWVFVRIPAIICRRKKESIGYS